MTRERFVSGDSVDADNGFVRSQRSGRDRAQRRAAVGEPQLRQRLCAFSQGRKGCGRIDRSAGFTRLARRFD